MEEALAIIFSHKGEDHANWAEGDPSSENIVHSSGIAPYCQWKSFEGQICIMNIAQREGPCRLRNLIYTN